MGPRQEGAMPKQPEEEFAAALLKVIGDSTWEAVAFAASFLAIRSGASDEASARIIYETGARTLKGSLELIPRFRTEGFVAFLSPRKKTGSAENPITKLFPATVTEERFKELAEELCPMRESLTFSDERRSGHGLVDFTLREGDSALPINIKNAGTRFEKARTLVGLEPDDCVPIPAYKAHGAVEQAPDLLYVISVDYNLIGDLDRLLPTLFNGDEAAVWELLNSYSGKKIRSAEDSFIFAMVTKYWGQIKRGVCNNPFHAISAKKAVRILHSKPKRTPGIGLRAWGTGASAEVNVHISISEETVPWSNVSEQIEREGLRSVLSAVNRTRQEEVFDPAI